MTLSRFLRDYLYIPLGGSQRGRLLTYRNLLLTMMIGGLWHGAAWTFVLWGALHGGVLAWETMAAGTARGAGPRTDRHALAEERTPPPHLSHRLPGMGSVSLGFDGHDPRDVLSRLGNPGTGTVGHAGGDPPHRRAGSGFSICRPTSDSGCGQGFGNLRPVPMALGLASFLLVLDALGPEGVAPFIYFQF